MMEAKFGSAKWRKMLLADSPETPLPILKELAEEKDKDILVALSTNLSIDESIMEIVADECSYYVASFLLRHPGTPAHIIEKIWSMKEPTKHQSAFLPFFLLHDNTPLEILEQLEVNGRECMTLLSEFKDNTFKHPYLDKMVFKLFTSHFMFVSRDVFMSSSNGIVFSSIDLLFQNDSLNIIDWFSWTEGNDKTLITQKEVREHLLSYLSHHTKVKDFRGYMNLMYGIDITGMSQDMVKGILQWD
jgi:hypothetical protein